MRTTSRCRPTGTEMREHRVLGHEKDEAPTGATAVLVGRQPYGARVQLRYAYRLSPTAGQRQALARAFGCARVVFNDAVAARRAAHEAGVPYPTDAALSKALTAAKRTPERAWLAEVSAVVLQQALADANTAYRNFFASLKGTRRGRRVGAPRFRSRKDRAQSIRFTRAARFRVTRPGGCGCPGSGTCRCAGPGICPVRRRRVTVTVDATGGTTPRSSSTAPTPRSHPRSVRWGSTWG